MAVSTEMKNATPEQRDHIIDRRRQTRMARIDAMEPDLRQCVYDYGLHVVNALIEVGVRKPKHIRHVVETVLNEFSPTRGASSVQGLRGEGERPTRG